MKSNRNIFWIGFVLLVIGIVQSILFRWPHYYSFFSIGMFLILFYFYCFVFGKSPFSGWDFKDHLLYWILILFGSIFLDIFGMAAGYWVYPHYNNLPNILIKYLFEWAIPFVYLSFGLLIGQKIFMKKIKSKFGAWMLSLFIFVTLLGLFTELFNMCLDSWRILKMPLMNYEIAGFFLIFQTIGYWTMAFIGHLGKIFVEEMKTI